MTVLTEKDLLWEWVNYVELHGGSTPSVFQPMSYGLWKSIKGTRAGQVNWTN